MWTCSPEELEGVNKQAAEDLWTKACGAINTAPEPHGIVWSAQGC